MEKDNTDVFNNEFAGSNEQIGELSSEDDAAIEKALKHIAAQMTGSSDEYNAEISDSNPELSDDIEAGKDEISNEENSELSDDGTAENNIVEDVSKETGEESSAESDESNSDTVETTDDTGEIADLAENIEDKKTEEEYSAEKVTQEETDTKTADEDNIESEIKTDIETDIESISDEKQENEAESESEINIQEKQAEIAPSAEEETVSDNISEEQSSDITENNNEKIGNIKQETNENYLQADELNDDGVVKKYIVYISKDFVSYIDNLSIDERSAYINDAIQQKIDALDERKIILERKRAAAHIIIAVATIFILLPIALFVAHKSIMATFDNYKYSQDSFERLYRQRFKQDNAYLRSLEYNKEYEKRLKSNKEKAND